MSISFSLSRFYPNLIYIAPDTHAIWFLPLPQITPSQILARACSRPSEEEARAAPASRCPRPRSSRRTRPWAAAEQARGPRAASERASSAPARVKSTALDKDPLAIYVIDAVVQPVELFKPALAPTPAPARARPGSRRGRRVRADADDSAPVDQKKDACPCP
ncbi:fasciclin-like arabinogalactan protein 8 [Panicum miliaceum]|uniref:Fasciclin-like arabinogalactan protein 8 n=1 Tax=Panicum miliaceum TaxID=4540 RepID=A0A3L6PNV9_PANMI|nr:fasciclin-like arabinogalactan protein 8 [Panicum miliaceum]